MLYHALSPVEHDTYVPAWALNPSAGIALLYGCDCSKVTSLHQPLGAQTPDVRDAIFATCIML